MSAAEIIGWAIVGFLNGSPLFVLAIGLWLHNRWFEREFLGDDKPTFAAPQIAVAQFSPPEFDPMLARVDAMHRWRLDDITAAEVTASRGRRA